MGTFFELAKSIDKKGAFRIWRNARTLKDIAKFVKENSGENIYTSVYQFSTLDYEKVVYESAIPDRLFIEFDGPDHGLLSDVTWRDLQKFISWCKSESSPGHEINPQIWFSGGSGYHVLFTLPMVVREYNSSKVIQRINQKLKYLTGCELLDMQANHGFTQLRRVPNTQHQKTKLYCIPLTVDEAFNFGPDKIMQLARKPRKLNNWTGDSTYFVEIIKFISDGIKRENDEFRRKSHESKDDRMINTSNIINETGLRQLRPCIFRLTKLPNPNFEESTWLACELIHCNYTDKQMMDIFKEIRREKFNYEMTRYQITMLRKKSIKPPSCYFLEQKNYCSREHHKNVYGDLK